jgi:hypothetical protein
MGEDLEFGTLNAPSSKRPKQAFNGLHLPAKPRIDDGSH